MPPADARGLDLRVPDPDGGGGVENGDAGESCGLAKY